MSIFPIIPLGNTFVGATYHAAKVFNDDFCDRVMKLIKEDAWVQAGTEDLKAKSKQQVKKEWRRTQIQALMPEEQTSFPYPWLGQAIRQFNNEVWRYELSGFNLSTDIPSIMKYEDKDKGFYDWHIDIMRTMPTRKLAFSLLLNDGYTGGQLEFVHANEPLINKLEQTKGTLIVFPSWVRHRVTPVTKGTRYALVGWMHGPSFV